MNRFLIIIYVILLIFYKCYPIFAQNRCDLRNSNIDVYSTGDNVNEQSLEIFDKLKSRLDSFGKVYNIQFSYKQSNENIESSENKIVIKLSQSLDKWDLGIDVKISPCNWTGQWFSLNNEEVETSFNSFILSLLPNEIPDNPYQTTQNTENEQVENRLNTTSDEESIDIETNEQNRNNENLGFIIGSTTLGLYLGLSLYYATPLDDYRYLSPILLVGGIAGLGTSLIYTRYNSVSKGDNSLILAGGFYGAGNGLMLMKMLAFDNQLAFGISALGETIGLSLSILAANYSEISGGDGAILHSSALWGLFVGGVIATLIDYDSEILYYGLLLAGLDVGILSGFLTSLGVEVSTGRVIISNLCGILGILLGASLGLPLVIDDPSSGYIRTYAGIMLGSAALGIGLGIIFTRNWDNSNEEQVEEISFNNSLINYSPYSKISFGVPIPYITSYYVGEKRVDTFNLNILGGVW